MLVVITVDVNSARHADLEKRIWEKFPSIGGIEKVSISVRQYTLSFDLQNEDQEQMRKFLDQEGVKHLFK